MQVASMNPSTIGTMEGTGDEPDSLLNQEYIRDSRRTIRDLIKEAVAQVRENIQVTRVMRFEVGTSGGAAAPEPEAEKVEA